MTLTSKEAFPCVTGRDQGPVTRPVRKGCRVWEFSLLLQCDGAKNLSTSPLYLGYRTHCPVHQDLCFSRSKSEFPGFCTHSHLEIAYLLKFPGCESHFDVSQLKWPSRGLDTSPCLWCSFCNLRDSPLSPPLPLPSCLRQYRTLYGFWNWPYNFTFSL